MKTRTLAFLAGVAAPLIVTAPASAGFVRVKATSKPNEFGLLVVNVYAVFDRPDPGDGSGDHMTKVAGTPNAPLNIEITGGTFFNSPFGGDHAPNAAFFPAFPSLAYDTFVTIGVKCLGDPPCQPADTLTITPGFPLGITGSSLATTISGWAIIPTVPQGDPFNPPFSFPGNGEILIGQFSTADGTAISGTFLMGGVSNGQSFQSIETFFCSRDGCECEGEEFCDAGDPCTEQEVCVENNCVPIGPSTDCNGNGIRDSCDIANGTSTDANENGIPDDCDVACQSDLDNDGEVGILDFLWLLTDWGVCP